MTESIIPDFFKIPDSSKILGPEIKNKSSNKRYKDNLFRYCFTLLD